MPSFKSIALAAIALFAMAQAQYTIDPDSVDINTRDQWCGSQTAACPLLCTQINNGSLTTAENTCDPTVLAYSCVCANGLSPNLTEYSQTIPYFECVEYDNQCVTACGAADTGCQSACRQDHPCGALDPTHYNITSTSSSMTATATGSASTSVAVYNGLGGSAATTTDSGSTPAPTTSSPSKSGAQAALDVGRSYGAIILSSAVFASFALVM